VTIEEVESGRIQEEIKQLKVPEAMQLKAPEIVQEEIIDVEIEYIAVWDELKDIASS